MSVSSDIKKTLSIFSLSCFLLGVLGSIALSAFNEDVAGIFAVVATVFTIVLGIVSWKEKLARVTVHIALGVLVVMVFWPSI